jgi:hypothetical protein
MDKGMNRRKLTLFLLITGCLITAFAASCGFFHHKIYAQLYFPEKSAQLLVPITVSVTRLTPSILISDLEKGDPNPKNLLPLFPDKGTFPQVSTGGKTIFINFKTPPPAEEAPLLIPGILATFQQLPKYKAVLFSVNGNPETLGEGGVELGRFSLRKFWINDNLDLTPFPYMTGEYQKGIVYLELKRSHYLVPVTLRFPGNITIEKAVAAAISESPDSMSWLLKTPLPSGFKILSVSRSHDGIVNIVIHPSGSSRGNTLANRALALSFCGISGVKDVRIRVGTGIFSWRPLQSKPNFVNIVSKNK